MANENLRNAKKAKNDEFYTQYHDIEIEVNEYTDFNPDVFRNKTILCPCDDPEWSNFTKYFAANFERLGLKKLICTSYAKSVGNRKTTMFEKKSVAYDFLLHDTHGKVYIRDATSKKHSLDINDLEWKYLKGDGDFRSNEVKALRDEADIIITNPPFSLFREFLAWILEGNKQFLIIGNKNSITYKEVFPLIKENEVWLGCTSPAEFGTPEGKTNKINGLARWFTNIEHGKRHEPLQLMTMEDNLRFNKKLQKHETVYMNYDNYPAIEIPEIKAIPSDYNGVMAVPITYLDSYCPEQFEILGITQRNNDPFKTKHYSVADYKNANDLNARGVILINGIPKPMYARILIKPKTNKTPD